MLLPCQLSHHLDHVINLIAFFLLFFFPHWSCFVFLELAVLTDLLPLLFPLCLCLLLNG